MINPKLCSGLVQLRVESVLKWDPKQLDFDAHRVWLEGIPATKRLYVGLKKAWALSVGRKSSARWLRLVGEHGCRDDDLKRKRRLEVAGVEVDSESG